MRASIGPIAFDRAADVETKQIAFGQLGRGRIGVSQSGTLPGGDDDKPRNPAAGANLGRNDRAQFELGDAGLGVTQRLLHTALRDVGGMADFFDLFRQLYAARLDDARTRIDGAVADQALELLQFPFAGAIQADGVLRFYMCGDGGSQRVEERGFGLRHGRIVH